MNGIFPCLIMIVFLAIFVATIIYVSLGIKVEITLIALKPEI